jgi:alanine racemase
MSNKQEALIHYPTVLEVNTAAITHNFRFFRKLLKPKTKIMAMIKASAYGNGAVEIGRLIQKEGLAEYISVAYISEGVELREAGIELPIMVLNPNPENFESLVKNCLEPEIHHIDHLIAFNSFLVKEKLDSSAYPIHLKINTGMNRLGIDPNHSTELLKILIKSKACRVKSLMTHLSASGTAEEDEYSLSQLKTFETFYQKVKKQLPHDSMLHALNSNGIYRFPNYHYDMVRLGIGMYGASDLPELTKKLKPICRFQTKVSQVLDLKKGESIGYSRAGKMSKDGKIATLSVGYADGFSRSLGNGNWKVEINGKLYPTIGDICMDLCMIELGNDDVKAGDEVTLFGGKKSIHDYTEALGTISYEAMCRIGERVERRIV